MSEPLTGPDGRQYTSVIVARSRPFARACIAILSAEDGADRTHWLGWKAFWVPTEVVEQARALLGKKEFA